MSPDLHPKSVALQALEKPVGNQKESVSRKLITSFVVPVELGQSILSDGDGVVLKAYVATVVEKRNSFRVERTRVIGFLSVRKIIFAQLGIDRSGIEFRCFVPKVKMTGSSEKVGFQ